MFDMTQKTWRLLQVFCWPLQINSDPVGTVDAAKPIVQDSMTFTKAEPNFKIRNITIVARPNEKFGFIVRHAGFQLDTVDPHQAITQEKLFF